MNQCPVAFHSAKGDEGRYVVQVTVSANGTFLRAEERSYELLAAVDATTDVLSRQVKRFKEKPDLELAKEFVASGEYLWNASTFVWRPEVFLDELRVCDPQMYEGVSAIAAAWDTPSRRNRAYRVRPFFH